MTLVVHPHFHYRRTGVTGHVESVVKASTQEEWEVRALGTTLPDDVPRVGLLELLRRARREPVVWHAHRNNELLAGLLLRVFGKSVRLVFTRHSTPRPGALTRMLMRRADGVVALTDEVAANVEVPSEIVSHGVDLARFRPPENRAKAFAALGLGGRFGIGVVGRIRPAKGQGDLAEAIAPLLPSNPEWRLAFVGQARPNDQAFLEGLRQKLGDRLALPGEQRDVLRWYHGLSILVHPSHGEAFSLVQLEAMAAGCCVVASRLPHLPRIVEHGRTGFLYPPGDVPALREILRELMADPARAQAVGRAAAEEASARFGIDREARALTDLYGRLLARSLPASGVA